MKSTQPNDKLVALARRFLTAIENGTSTFDSLGPLADHWLATQSSEVLHRLSRGNPQLRGDLEELLRNYFLQGFLVAVRAAQENSVCE